MQLKYMLKWRDNYEISRSSHQRCSIKQVCLKISRNSQENTCARVSFLLRRFWHRCFPVNFAKCLRTHFLQNTSGRLLLNQPPVYLNVFFNFKTVVSQFTVLLSRFRLGSQNQLDEFCRNIEIFKIQVKLGLNLFQGDLNYTAQKMKFSWDQIRSFLRIWSHLLKKYLMENFIFCAVLE